MDDIKEMLNKRFEEDMATHLLLNLHHDKFVEEMATHLISLSMELHQRLLEDATRGGFSTVNIHTLKVTEEDATHPICKKALVMFKDVALVGESKRAS